MKKLSVIILLVLLVFFAMDTIAPPDACAGIAANDKPKAVLKYKPATRGQIAFGVGMFIAGILTVKYL